MTQTTAQLCDCRDGKAGDADTAILELHPLGALSASAMPMEILVVLELGRDRWWEIAWRDPATNLIDGPWRYTPDLRDAEPVAWYLLPPISIASKRGG